MTIVKMARIHSIAFLFTVVFFITLFANCSTAVAAVCGNGIKEFPEVCDDGNTSWTAGTCAADCSGLNWFTDVTRVGYNVCPIDNWAGSVAQVNFNRLCWEVTYGQFPVAAYIHTWNIGCSRCDHQSAFLGGAYANGEWTGGSWQAWVCADPPQSDYYLCKPDPNAPPVYQISVSVATATLAAGRVQFYGFVHQPGIVNAYYQIDGTSGAWTPIKKCQTTVFAGRKIKYQFVTPALAPGRHTVYVKGFSQTSSADPGRELISDPFNFTVAASAVPSGAQPVWVAYDPQALLAQYGGEPNGDPAPEDNLHLFRKEAGGWVEAPVAGVDKINKAVSGKTDSFSGDYSLVYISPGCAVDE